MHLRQFGSLWAVLCTTALFDTSLSAQSQADSVAVLQALTDSLRADRAAVIVTRFDCSRATLAAQPEACEQIGNARWSAIDGGQMLRSLAESLPVRTATPESTPLPICPWWSQPGEPLSGQLVTIAPPIFTAQGAEVEVDILCGEAEGTRLSLAVYRYLLSRMDDSWQIIEKRLELIT